MSATKQSLKHVIVLAMFSFQLLLSCKNRKTQWDIAVIDRQLPYNSTFADLDTQEELSSPIESLDSSMRKTSNVTYYDKHVLNKEDTEYLNLSNCRAYFIEPDTVIIKIGFRNYLSGKGFEIKYIPKKFHTKPYFFSDLKVFDNADPDYKIIHQSLILNKEKYVLGDSLYGYINFKSVETYAKNHEIEHFGIGFFRTKIISR